MTLPTARWIQRLQNFKMASEQLSLFLAREHLNPLEDAQLWMDMIGARARTSHTYDLKMASAVVKEIQTAYAPAFQKLIQSLESQNS
jgi:hypothetical protein